MPDSVNTPDNKPEAPKTDNKKPKVIHIQKGNNKTTTTESSLEFMKASGWKVIQGAT